MTTHGWSWKLGLASALVVDGAILTAGDCVLAQSRITPDTTLGASERSLVRTNVEINGLPADRIEGGAQRGANLFHSFQQFNVGENQRAYFSNPTGIENILSRVTGNDPSNILGTLGVLGNANLFLMNPNGIFFGPNASLDVNGSFMATTANAIQLGDTGLFSASEPATSNLLTVNPSALFFNAVNRQAEIINRSTALRFPTDGDPSVTFGLEVPEGRSLLLVGGNVILEGGILRVAGGRIELGSVAGDGEVSLGQTGDRWKLGYDSIATFGNIRLEGGAVVDTRGENGGDVQIQGAQLNLTQGSSIFADTFIGDGGEVLVRTTEAITLGDGSQITADTFGSGTGGDLTIDTEQLTVQDGAQVSADTSGTGAGGNLTIETGQLSIRNGAAVSAGTTGEGAAGSLVVNATKSVEVIGESADGQDASVLTTQVNPGATGDGGDLTIETGQLSIRDGAQISAGTFGNGDAGELTVQAADSVEVIGKGKFFFSNLSTSAESRATGDGGNLTIETGQLSIRDGAEVSAGTTGEGAGGNLVINATKSVEVIGESADGEFGSGLFTQVEPGATGDGGNLTIETGQLSIRDGAQVSASTLGTGDGGTLIVNASDSVEVIGTDGDISPSSLITLTFGAGDAGNLTIATGQLSVREGGTVSASTAAFLGKGRGGNLTINASESVEVIGTEAGDEDGKFFSSLVSETGRLSYKDFGLAPAPGGNLTINTRKLTIRDGAVVSTSTYNIPASPNLGGQAGNLIVNASESVEVIGTDADGSISGLIAKTEGTGDAGELRIDTRQLSIRDGAAVTVSSEGTGNAGNLEAKADSIRLENQALLSSDTTGGQGNIILNSQDLVSRHGSNITTNATGTAPGGNIKINTDVLAALENSDISANAQAAFGGRVQIDAQGIIGTEFRANLTPQSDITATSDLGPQFSGTVQINTSDVEVQNSLTPLSINFISPEQVVAGSCLARRNAEQGSFTITGTGGLPRSPYEAISGRYSVTGVQPIQAEGPASKPTQAVERAWKLGDPIREAQGIVVTADGRTIVGTNPQLMALAKAQNLVCHSN